jgi:DNA-binding NarL/FixJ family response regulator
MDAQPVSPKSPQRIDCQHQRCKFLIVSGIRFLSEGLAEILAREPWIEISGVSASVSDAISTSRALLPDFILLDAALDGGLAAVAQFRDVVSRVRVVALAIAETEQDVVSWAEAGAAGYIPRTAALADLAQLLIGINDGRQPCSSRVVFGLLRRLGAGGGRVRDESHSVFPLTGRERQITELIRAGLSNKEIARRLNIGLSTTKSHVHNLLGKLSLQRRGQVAAWTRGHSQPAAGRAGTPSLVDEPERVMAALAPVQRLPGPPG